MAKLHLTNTTITHKNVGMSPQEYAEWKRNKAQTERKCKRCRQMFPLSEYIGSFHTCRECRNESARRYKARKFGKLIEID